MKFVCIDFETANSSRVSMCAAGLAIFSNGKLVRSKHWLVKPPAGHDHFSPFNIGIHGITPEHVRKAPLFTGIMDEFLDLIKQGEFVAAHNAGFDMSVLRRTLEHFDRQMPAFEHRCTCRLARKVWPDLPNHRLNTVIAHIGHRFRHHNAEEDAIAAGYVIRAATLRSSIREKTCHE